MADSQPDSKPESKPLPDPPTDGISNLSYLPVQDGASSSSSSSLLASTSWDGSVRIHDTVSRQLKLSHSMESGPLLGLSTMIDGQECVVTGGLDGSIRILNIPTSTPQIVGKHLPANDDGTAVACSCLAAVSSDTVASTGWDKKFNLWDIRGQKEAVVSIDLPGKGFCMDLDRKHNRIVVGTSGRQTCFIDLRKTSDSSAAAELVLNRESSLKFQTRTIRFFPDGDAIAVGSVEGRVAVEYMTELGLAAKGKKYAFKCHRAGDLVYPVNCIDFHPRLGTFATGGGDGIVAVWDGLNKKKLTSFPQLPTSIGALTFNHDGTELAMASSYTFEDGEREHPRDEIYTRKILDSDCMPKTKS